MLGCGQILSTKLKTSVRIGGGESFNSTVTISDVRILSFAFAKSSSVFHSMKTLRILIYICKTNGLRMPTLSKLPDAIPCLILVK